MKNRKNFDKGMPAVSLCSMLAAGQVFAAGLVTTPDPASVAPGGNVNIIIQHQGDGTNNAISGALDYDTATFNATVVDFVAGGTCAINDGIGRVAFAGSVSTAGNTEVCEVTFTADPGAVEADYTLTFANVTFGIPSGGDTMDNGQITVQLAPPTTQTVTASGNTGGTVSPASQDVASGATAAVTITPNAGFQLDSIGGTCAAGAMPVLPTTAAVNYVTGAIGTAGDPNNSADCTVIASFSAIPFPQIDPASGDFSCASGGTININVSNPGTLALNFSGCALGGASFTGLSFPPSIAAGASGVISVTCPTIAEGDPDITDAITCTHDAAGSPAVYNLTASAIPPIPPAIAAPDVVPASSLWSKLMLFGFLAGLGALVIALRRS